METATVRKDKKQLVPVLNKIFKEKRDQLSRNAISIIKACEVDSTVAILGVSPCLITTLSLDSRGRAQRSMRVPHFTGQEKTNFRPWHITWIDKNGVAPVELQYSHRCHNENCCEESHGLWETDQNNKFRWSCRLCSHLLLPNGRIFKICPHEPCCLKPLIVDSWADPRFIN